MSVNNVLKFLTLIDKDEGLKFEFYNVLNEYNQRDFNNEETDNLIVEKVLPMAERKGLEFTLKDIKVLFSPD